jgi:flagellar biosynthesis chaperone FliJ
MANNNIFETTQKLNQPLYEANKAIIESAVATQERTVQLVQTVFENGIEILKSHIEASQSLLQNVSDKAQDPMSATQVVLDSAVAAQKRNVAFGESVLEDSVKAVRSYATATQELAQTLMQKSQEQQKAFANLPYAKAYTEMFYAPLSSYETALNNTRKLTGQAIDFAEQTTRQGYEAGQKASHIATETTKSATRQAK